MTEQLNDLRSESRTDRAGSVIQALLRRSRLVPCAELTESGSFAAAATRVATEVRSRDFARTRTYRMMPLAIDCTDKGSGLTVLLDREFINHHWRIQVFRWKAGKRPALLDRLCLIGVLHSLKRIEDDLGHPTEEEFEGMLSEAAFQGGDSGRRKRSSGFAPRLRLRAKAAVLNLYCRLKLLTGYLGNRLAQTVDPACQGILSRSRRRVAEVLRDAAVGRLSKLDSLLLDLMFGPRARRSDAARIITDTFLDRSTGMMFREPARISRRLFYIRPLLVLALMTVVRREKLQIVLFSGAALQEEALAEGTSPKGSDFTAVEFLNAWDLDNKTPPDLKLAWGPGPPSFQVSDADRVVEDILKRSIPALAEIELVPPGAAFVFSMRHDVDRPLRAIEIETIRKFEIARGIASTWFFKPETYDFGVASALLQQGCEVGYHCSSSADGDGGFAQRLRDELGATVSGVSFHGGFGSFYWQGVSTLRHIAALGYRYSEWPADFFMHPRPWPWQQPRLYLTPPGVKVQVRPGLSQTHFDFVIGGRGHVIIEDHPDLFNPALQDTVDRLLDKGGISRSLGQHVDACRLADDRAHNR